MKLSINIFETQKSWPPVEMNFHIFIVRKILLWIKTMRIKQQQNYHVDSLTVCKINNKKYN